MRLSAGIVVAAMMAAMTAAARTWHLAADGTGDAPAIKAAIPDGSINTDFTAVFTCCGLDPARWLVYGTLVRDDADSGTVPVEDAAWGSFKALYR